MRIGSRKDEEESISAEEKRIKKVNLWTDGYQADSPVKCEIQKEKTRSFAALYQFRPGVIEWHIQIHTIFSKTESIPKCSTCVRNPGGRLLDDDSKVLR